MMQRRLAGVMILGLCSVVSVACSPPPDTPALTESGLADIVGAEIATLMTDPGYRAVSAAIYIDSALHTFHYGALETGARPDNATLYEIGSITKTHTGLVLAQAVLDGRIGLDDPVAQYLPEIDPAVFERDGHTATIRHLATHLSGMPANLACGEADMTKQARLDCFWEHDREDLLARLAGMRLKSMPGERYIYSNAGIKLLGYILEDIYGERYSSLVARIVFARTGQTDTHFRLKADDRLRLATGHRADGDTVPDAHDDVSPAGGLKATTADIGRYMAFYLDGDAPLAREAMSLLAGDPDGLGRAYIWNTFRLETEGMLYHGGGTFGTSSWISLYPREGLGVFLVTPYVSDNAQGMLNETANRIVDALRTANRATDRERPQRKTLAATD